MSMNYLSQPIRLSEKESQRFLEALYKVKYEREKKARILNQLKQRWSRYWHQKGQELWKHSLLREKGKLKESLFHKLSEKALHKILLIKRDIRSWWWGRKTARNFNNVLRRQGKLPLRRIDKAYDLGIGLIRRLGFNIPEKVYPEPY